MPDNQHRLKYLYDRFIHDEITADELQEFWRRIRDESPDEDFVRSAMSHYQDELPPEIAQKDWGKAENKLFGSPLSRRVVPFHSLIWKAASILLVVGAAAYFFLKSEPETLVQNSVQQPIPVQPDIVAPANSYATITLANGHTIQLDSAGHGQLAMQDNVSILKSADGSIHYGLDGQASATAITFNTLTNPRGSRVISMVLSDGSRVWLNAESSITYPVAFAGTERKVTVSGEAYFEISADPHKKFIVESTNLRTEVFGTHFNVRAYADDEKEKVTLLEGSVSVSTNGGQQQILKPGEQAEESNNGGLQIHRNIDMDDVMAWKDERFSFRVANIKSIMKEVARWYNVEIRYQGDLRELNFGGSMSRQSNVSELLKRLEATQEVRFEVVGQVITVIKN